ncbi:Crotonobetainyl-CoA:carnitine CoA-transferase CaiB [Sulfitobacter brevis]|uniref:Crotonobetainyl-CoA:carnitine CoA-transferase CaiB n=1 Tax=Sulfitobacter brevis TaxID=74348 RepID=A0A1I2F328_9RHOB|nr:CoA transferase [Sulfitobacter brevis]SFE99409.1 Crotonobetainyl-CoA:carnitine CoA-transferase CaiB [Sulfitobacter brevis]
MSTQILKGLRVLDLSRMLSGPYCTMHLADHGAEVIKIEGADGDTSRGNGPFSDDDPSQDWAGYFISLNRGKKSIQLDLKSPDGKANFRKLAATADVIVENFRPGVMERLGLAYETLAADNPKLVYAAIRGFGDPRTGQSPYSDWPSYDVVAQAMGGLMAMTGPDAATPTKTGPGVGDIFAGMMMAFGIMAALREAEATGKGQFVDVAMYDAMISLCERMVYLHDMTGNVPGPEGNGHPFLAPFGLFPAKDGHIALGIVDDTFWQRLANLMGLPALQEDPRFASRAARAENSTKLNSIVADWSNAHTKAELTALLGGEVPYGPLNTIADIVNDPHVIARGMLSTIQGPDPLQKPWTVAANPLRFGAYGNSPLASPPALGADNDLLNTLVTPNEMDADAKRALRNAFGSFATGVTVVTTRQADGTPRGFTANSFTSVSLDPPLLLVCIAKSAQSCEAFEQSEHFAINILADTQKEISGLFASQSSEKFNIAKWSANAQNMPLIEGSLTNFGCARERLVDAGDHLILIGRVLNFETHEGAPLGYYKGAYFDVGLDTALADAAAKTMGVSLGAVLARGEHVLLLENAKGELSVPTPPPEANTVDGLVGHLKGLGLTPALDHLYAIYQNTQSGQQRLIYHGVVDGDPPENMRYFNLCTLPFDRIMDDAERSMLQRYARENRHGTFGIYHGTEVKGVVHTLAGHQEYHI